MSRSHAVELRHLLSETALRLDHQGRPRSAALTALAAEVDRVAVVPAGSHVGPVGRRRPGRAAESELQEWTTTVGAASALGVGRRQILKLVDQGHLAAIHLNDRTTLVERRSLAALVTTRSNP